MQLQEKYRREGYVGLCWRCRLVLLRALSPHRGLDILAGSYQGSDRGLLPQSRVGVLERRLSSYKGLLLLNLHYGKTKSEEERWKSETIGDHNRENCIRGRKCEGPGTRRRRKQYKGCRRRPDKEIEQVNKISFSSDPSAWTPNLNYSLLPPPHKPSLPPQLLPSPPRASRSPCITHVVSDSFRSGEEMTDTKRIRKGQWGKTILVSECYFLFINLSVSLSS